jgi:hypothetical protein
MPPTTLSSRQDQTKRESIMNSVDMLTVPEAGAYIRFKPSTVRSWILKRRITYHKIHGKVFLRRCDLDKLISDSLIPAKEKVDGKQSL